MHVWMSALRKDSAWHTIGPNGRKTVCGGYIGTPTQVEHGHVLPIVRAVDDYAAKQCATCAGDAVRIDPGRSRY